jgi:hypothetical protein
MIFEVLIIPALALSDVVFVSPPHVPATVNGDEPIAATVILDAGDVGNRTWRKSLILTRQLISLLCAGDEFTLICSYKDRSTIEASCKINPNDTGQQASLSKTLMNLNYRWWSHTNLSDGLQLAYEQISNRPYSRKFCILVTDGSVRNSEVELIRNKAALLKLSNISLLIVVSKSANQNLVLAGNSGEFDIVMLDGADIGRWLEKIRPRMVIPSPVERMPWVSPPPPSPPQPPVRPQPVPLPQLPAPMNLDRVVTNPPKVIPPPAKPQQDRRVLDDSTRNVPSMPQPPILNPESKITQPKDGITKTFSQTLKSIIDSPFCKHILKWWWLYGAVIMAIALSMFLVWVVLVAKSHSYKNTIENKAKEQQDLSRHLLAEYNSQQYDLGELCDISTLTFGKLISSPVPLDGEDVAEKEFEIRLAGQELEVRNKANKNLALNGIGIKAGKRSQFTLPAAVETASGVRINLSIEESPENTNSIKKGGLLYDNE